jgi:hypothetical protein
MLELIKLEQTKAAKCGSRRHWLFELLIAACLLQFGSSPALSQTASLRGQVFDQSGAVGRKPLLR